MTNNDIKEKIELEDLWNWEVGLKEDVLNKYITQIQQEAKKDCEILVNTILDTKNEAVKQIRQSTISEIIELLEKGLKKHELKATCWCFNEAIDIIRKMK